MKSKVNVKCWKVLGIIILAVAFLAGCAAKKPFWGDPETGLVFQYRLSSGQAVTFESNTMDVQSMEMMGQAVDTETNVTSNYTVQGKGLDKDKNILSEAKFNSLTIDVSSPQGDMDIDTSPVIGKPFGVTFSPLGKELDYSGIDSTMMISMGQAGNRSIKDLFRNPLQDLPDHPVKIGDSWMDIDSLTTPQGGLDITIKTENELTFEGFEEVEGIECAKITVKGNGTIDGSGQQMGMDVALEGDLEIGGTLYFAYKKGMFVKTITETFTEMTAALSGQMNMTIPITQESKSEVNLIQ
ncbi:hypothetical protein ACFL6A_02300 [bacterium]